jgi:preprotein translocase subunit SecG
MYQVIIVIHVLLGLGVIGLVLMQQGKGADAGAAFGSGSAGSVFGAQGAASFLSRSTAILATLFFSTSLALAVINGHKETGKDIMATPATEQNVPSVQGAKNDTLPPVAPTVVIPPAAVATEKPATTPAATVEPVVSQPETPAKPAEETKPVEAAKPEVKKPAEHNKPATKDKKADTKSKDKKK